MTLLASLHNPSLPHQASPCLITMIACWACTLNYSGVMHDRVDTLNSTLPSGVSFLAFGRSIHCLLEFFHVQDQQKLKSFFLVHSWGYSPYGAALLHTNFMGSSEFGSHRKKGPEKLTWSFLCKRHDSCCSHA